MSDALQADGWLLRFLRRGVLKHLNVALHDSKGALSGEWVDRDPDLKAVRDANALDWRIVWERNRGSGAGKPTDPDWHDVEKLATQLVGEMRDLHGHPDRPWGDPARRHYAWSLVVAVLALGVIVLLLAGVTDELLLTVLAGLAALAAIRTVLLARETWRTWTADPESSTDAAGWERRSMFWWRIVFALGVGALIYFGSDSAGAVWQLLVVLGLLFVLALVWAVIATQQARWQAAVATQFAAVDPNRVSPTRL